MLAHHVVCELFNIRKDNLKSRKLGCRLRPAAFLPLARSYALSRYHMHIVFSVCIYKTAHCKLACFYLGNVEYSLAQLTECRRHNCCLTVSNLSRNIVRNTCKHAVCEELIELKIRAALTGKKLYHCLCNVAEAVVFRNCGNAENIGKKHKYRCRREAQELLHSVNILQGNCKVSALLYKRRDCEEISCRHHLAFPLCRL